ncbi:MAG: hypothetical protein WCN92_04890 [Eubacteriales bacterium]
MDKSVKTILTGIAIPVFGLALLGLTFLLDAQFQNLIDRFFPHSYNMNVNWFPPFKHILFLVLIMTVSFFILKAKKLKDFYKAVYSTVPTAVLLATAGLSLYGWPIVQYSVCVLIYAAIILYSLKTKKSWMYGYAVTLVALTLLIMVVAGVEI